jgi:hypothetical protein
LIELLDGRAGEPTKNLEEELPLFFRSKVGVNLFL